MFGNAGKDRNPCGPADIESKNDRGAALRGLLFKANHYTSFNH